MAQNEEPIFRPLIEKYGEAVFHLALSVLTLSTVINEGNATPEMKSKAHDGLAHICGNLPLDLQEPSLKCINEMGVILEHWANITGEDH